MQKKEILELKKRFKKSECTFTKMCGCYVNAEKEIVLNINETFLNLEDEEFYKYLEIAKKTLSGTVGNNLLELEFPLEEEKAGGRQQFLMGLRESGLKNEALLETFFQRVIETYDYPGNYLILIFHDAYDVMKKTSDNLKLDESEEVYEYLLCALCPVDLTKPGLGYLQDVNRIGPRVRDWMVGVPDTGFVFPAFTDRSTDIHSVMFYTKNAKDPHKEFMEDFFGCPVKTTATEQKNTFQAIINHVIGDEEQSAKVLMNLQENLTQMVEDHAEFSTSDEPALLTSDSIQNLLADSKVPEEIAAQIETVYEQAFGDTPPVVDHLIDSKVLKESAQRRKELELEEKVQILQEKLEETTKSASLQALRVDSSSQNEMEDDALEAASFDSDEAAAPVEDGTLSEASAEKTGALYDVILRVKPQKLDQIKSEIIDGKKCIIIPMEEDEQANVNGITTF